jgi:hypothetical protein
MKIYSKCGTVRGMGLGVAEGLPVQQHRQSHPTQHRCAHFNAMDSSTQFSTVEGCTTFSTRPTEDSATALLTQHTCAGLLISTPSRNSLINWLAQEWRLDLTQVEQWWRHSVPTIALQLFLSTSTESSEGTLRTLPVRPCRCKTLQVATIFNHSLAWPACGLESQRH